MLAAAWLRGVDRGAGEASVAGFARCVDASLRGSRGLDAGQDRTLLLDFHWTQALSWRCRCGGARHRPRKGLRCGRLIGLRLPWRSVYQLDDHVQLPAELALVLQRNPIRKTRCCLLEWDVRLSRTLVLANHSLVDDGDMKPCILIALNAPTQVHDSPSSLPELLWLNHNAISVLLILDPLSSRWVVAVQSELNAMLSSVFQSRRLPDTDVKLHMRCGTSQPAHLH
mmetsp:Transcript_98123/g.277522  ORF Transcript_98123/g.277522 Transcript_98123/m.277522 type:complete len:226 (+) Transcript_98123:146-823(+)